MEKAAAVACLGGYNTLCEVLSLGKRCLVVPRGEELPRAKAARKLGLVQVLHPDQLSLETLAEALAQLPVQPPPATDRIPGLLAGLSYVTSAVGRWRSEGRHTVRRTPDSVRAGERRSAERSGGEGGGRHGSART